MLPFYWLFPTPATIQVLQAAIITSAVIPLWKVGARHGLTGVQRILLCATLLLCPAYSGGTSYDMHENCFLTPLLLWLFYGIDGKNTIATAASSMLTLTVKEDAAVYVAVIALWLIVKSILRFKKPDVHSLITGITMLLVSLCWFFAATGYLTECGDGVMTYRYENFQYTFGSIAFLFYLTVVNLSDMQIDRRRTIALAAAAIVSAACFCKITVPRAIFYPVRAIQYDNYYKKIRTALDTVPAGASVTASTFYTTQLSQRETLYDVRYCSQEHLPETEYVVLALSANSDYAKYAAGGKDNGLDQMVTLLDENGYKQFLTLKNVLIIYQKQGVSPGKI